MEDRDPGEILSIFKVTLLKNHGTTNHAAIFLLFDPIGRINRDGQGMFIEKHAVTLCIVIILETNNYLLATDPVCMFSDLKTSPGMTG